MAHHTNLCLFFVSKKKDGSKLVTPHTSQRKPDLRRQYPKGRKMRSTLRENCLGGRCDPPYGKIGSEKDTIHPTGKLARRKMRSTLQENWLGGRCDPPYGKNGSEEDAIHPTGKLARRKMRSTLRENGSEEDAIHPTGKLAQRKMRSTLRENWLGGRCDPPYGKIGLEEDAIHPTGKWLF
ncbi:hypothetical protein CHS0354_031661 [Potamilus streckersoni]|uniref:Uncharacterized protein n=1 Tax=Potamilus streckersoni TaxID=2493646 RepID=A0AAE0WCE1_9BIVA|nr:hypothetical protein CHS0354_031661 [Potamilus streckersoni]